MRPDKMSCALSTNSKTVRCDKAFRNGTFKTKQYQSKSKSTSAPGKHLAKNHQQVEPRRSRAYHTLSPTAGGGEETDAEGGAGEGPVPNDTRGEFSILCSSAAVV